MLVLSFVCLRKRKMFTLRIYFKSRYLVCVPSYLPIPKRTETRQGLLRHSSSYREVGLPDGSNLSVRQCLFSLYWTPLFLSDQWHYSQIRVSTYISQTFGLSSTSNWCDSPRVWARLPVLQGSVSGHRLSLYRVTQLKPTLCRNSRPDPSPL